MSITFELLKCKKMFNVLINVNLINDIYSSSNRRYNTRAGKKNDNYHGQLDDAVWHEPSLQHTLVPPHVVAVSPQSELPPFP